MTTNAKPTYDNVDPIPARQMRNGVNVGREFDVDVWTSNAAIAAIRRAFLLTKGGHDAFQTGLRYGRFDGRRQMLRAVQGAQDVYRLRKATSPTKVKCAVILDASGSMGAGDAWIEDPRTPGRKVQVTRAMAAAVFGSIMVKALGTLNNVTLEVFQHAGVKGQTLIKYRWAKGTPTSVFNEAARGYIGAHGNADGHALMAVATRMKRSLRKDERGIILMVSDGLPTDYTRDGTSNARQALVDAVRLVRAMGIEVIAVAIEGSDQSAYYGKSGMIPFTGSWTDLGITLTQHVGALLQQPARV